MGEVPVRLLNQETASVLARVKRGEEIDVTERGTVVARLVPAGANPLSEIAASGKLRLPALDAPMPRPSGPVREDDESGEIVSAMRDEECC